MIWNIDPTKINNYLLYPSKSKGKHQFFEGRGFSLLKWQVLRDSLLQHPQTATLMETDKSSPYGTKLIFECNLSCPDGTTPCIRSVWMEKTPDEAWFITGHALD